MKKQKPEAPKELKKKFAAVPEQSIDFTKERKEVTKLIDRAMELADISTKEDLDVAITQLSLIQAKKNFFNEGRLKITRKIDESKAAVMDWFRPFTEELEFYERLLKDSMSQYRAVEEKRIRAEAEAVRKKQAAGKISAATAERKLEAIEAAAPPTTIKGSGGGAITFRVEKEVVIDKEKDIPEEYWVLDMAAIERDLRAGKHVPGARMQDKGQKGVAGK